jgi:hypothetical protein
VSRFNKDPDARLDYMVDWTSWLGEDTIANSEWVVPDGITYEADTFTSTTATVWLSGGSLGSSYDVVNRITTVAGRIDDRTITIKIRQK